MSAEAPAGTEPRTPLSRDRVLRAAVDIADKGGIASLTMRRLGETVGAEAMSLYYHVANKEALLDGVADVMIAEIVDAVADIPAPPDAAAWKGVMRSRILTAREVLLRHPWAPGVLQSRTAASPAVLSYIDTTLGIMVAGGFTYDQAHHAMHALGSRAFGFAQELFNPAGDPGEEPHPEVLAGIASQFPHLAAMIVDAVHNTPENTLGWCDDQTEFEFGLDLLLNGLDGMRPS
ncbi:transcriptional regulator, TetR family [Catenulispora acidiphila DSM 44928]|uniref:Transcriptional regulator, TetR family n=1 Tax=Catenulispora acidiphila (strain DSM 44928 / JCM 14897 / NBRC 102108 / NRRL B-24433 / ID139908) TaxID=479433 RepID=C7Q4B4_CATAD|nr:TetR/AcrR family transcriptional regulator C-terminal domain-containing protein [Catenulispora acidiphila]ACU69974.1 transcriptional regulator, TetR family [Catenulispora acidiphila DSM 44928]